MLTGVALIAAERQRQIEGEGFDAKRDDAYINGEMLLVAACYTASACGIAVAEVLTDSEGQVDVHDLWPESWDKKSWDKRDTHTRLQQLAMAGALIAADMDRLIRLGHDAAPIKCSMCGRRLSPGLCPVCDNDE